MKREARKACCWSRRNAPISKLPHDKCAHTYYCIDIYLCVQPMKGSFTCMSRLLNTSSRILPRFGDGWRTNCLHTTNATSKINKRQGRVVKLSSRRDTVRSCPCELWYCAIPSVPAKSGSGPLGCVSWVPKKLMVSRSFFPVNNTSVVALILSTGLTSESISESTSIKILP